jgi:hypothetical protein
VSRFSENAETSVLAKTLNDEQYFEELKNFETMGEGFKAALFDCKKMRIEHIPADMDTRNKIIVLNFCVFRKILVDLKSHEALEWAFTHGLNVRHYFDEVKLCFCGIHLTVLLSEN